MKRTNDFTKHINYVKVNKFSKVIQEIRITDRQRVLIQDILIEIYELQIRLNNVAIAFDPHLFLVPKLLLEGESSCLIEGTRSMVEDFVYDIEGINNIPQWTARNLIDIYKHYLLNDHNFKTLKFSTKMLYEMHAKLYAKNPNSKFKMVYDTTNEIKRVKPGQILTNDSKPNFIGVSKNINLASLIMLKPSLKKDYLDDLFTTIEMKLANRELLVDHIILSHPIFEAIHPFNDSNGRIGRVLLSLLFKKLWNLPSVPIYLSEAFAQNPEQYKKMLLNVQLNNDARSWNKYIDYFVSCLIFTKKQMQNRITKIINIFNYVKANKKIVSTLIRKRLVIKFFKHMILNKNLTIQTLKKRFPNVSVQTIYNDWNLVTSELKVISKGDGYYVFSEILKIIRETI